MATATPGNQSQLRHTQPPSKVLHVRNLPWECSEEELVELCKPFGKVLNTKLNVGANHNQAFVEFADISQAIAMVSYYSSSAEPAQVRGKAVYLQYSTRQEILAAKLSADATSNVLLVTIEGVEAGDVSIDVIHLVFSAFGFVHKIATFEKAAGFQALVQFDDLKTASNAKANLEGMSIPKYLLPSHLNACFIRISFSAHTDLNVKFQSHRSRDYTNLHLPVSSSVNESSEQASDYPIPLVEKASAVVKTNEKKKELESNVLLVTIENMEYAVTIDVLYMVFSSFGNVKKIAIFEKFSGFQALIQYPDIPTAMAAKAALEGHCIYDGGYCKLKITFSLHTDLHVRVNNERTRDFTTQPPTPQPSIEANSVPSPHQPAPYPTNQTPAMPPPQAWEYSQASNPPPVPLYPMNLMSHPPSHSVQPEPQPSLDHFGSVLGNVGSGSRPAAVFPLPASPVPPYFGSGQSPMYGHGHGHGYGYGHGHGQYMNPAGLNPYPPPGTLSLDGSMPRPPAGSVYGNR